MDRTYGKIQYDDPYWAVETEPHVAIRLKRLFPRVRERASTSLIRATDEICRDLEWFLKRYPLEISKRDKAFMHERSVMHEDRMTLVESLMSKRVAPPDFELALPLRDYQRVAVELALQMKGLLIADELGLGKSAEAIGTFTCKDTLPALVVTMPHLCKQWEREVNRFAPKLRTHIVKKGKPYDLIATGRGGTRTLFDRFPDVIIMNYHKLAGWARTLAAPNLISSVVFDESQELRRSESDKYSAAKQIADAVKYRTGLTATPIYGYGSEFHNVIECLRPDALGSNAEFLREWCDVNSRHSSIRDPKAFGTYLREQGIMIRRTRTEAGRELPAFQVIPQYIDADLAEIEKVSKNVAELAKIILQQGRKGFDKMKAAEELDMRMRQVTGVAKAPFVAEFVKLLVDSGEPVVVYAWHREVYSILRDKLKDYLPAMYTGSESAVQKEAAVNSFIEGKTKIILISLRAGAGLDGLQKVCRTTVHAELDWSPGVHDQNWGRVYRDGQEQPVTSYMLIAEAGSDPIVADVLGIKNRQIEPVLDPNADLIEKLAVKDDNIRKLAERVLMQQGIPMPEPLPKTEKASQTAEAT